MGDRKLGVYCQPAAIATTPDYAKRLVEEAGVDHFIIRSGYESVIPGAQEKAVQVVRDLKADVEFMLSTWWGSSNVKVIDNLPAKTWESRFPMDMPGAASDAKIISKLEDVCGKYHPDAICMTHARYRHPGYLDGIFDEGTGDAQYQSRMEAAGIPRRETLEARAAWEKAMGALDNQSLITAAEKGIVEFLCELSQSDALRRLLSFRRETVRESLLALRKTVTGYGAAFGANAYSPWGAELCGQDYDNVYSETCDFVQPLLCYMEWHRYEPLAAWGRYLNQYTKADMPTSIEAAKILFGLGGTVTPVSFDAFDTCLEGDMESIYSIVDREIAMCAPYTSKPYSLQPVLRGMQWDWSMTDKLISGGKALGIDSYIFVGCEYLTKGPSPLVDVGSTLVGWA